MTAALVAAALDGKREGRGWRCRCPVHRGRSLIVADGKEGRLLVKCWGGACSPVDILAALRRLELLDRKANYRLPLLRAPSNDRDDASRQIAAARSIWNATRDARGTPATRYLAGRGLTLPTPPSLRWEPSLRRPDGTHGPAMIARIDSIDGEMIGIARTWLDRDQDGRWVRRDRAMLGQATGGAVRLARAGELLAVGEGVETSLAVLQATGIPTWAALSTAGLVSLILPPIVRTVIICADHDVNGAGERAARRAAERWWLVENRQVLIAMPPEAGTDMADVLAGRSYERIAKVCDVAA